MDCRWCRKKFTKKSNLDRHVYNQHDNKSIHHHGLTYVDKQYIKRNTECFLHDGKIRQGMMFHCFVCNFSVCADCMEEECKFCNKDICRHKKIIIIIN